MIAVDRLCKRFGDIVAVDDVSFEVRRGETSGRFDNGTKVYTTIHYSF